MELNKEKGPIYSRYDRDRSDNYSAVIDYAAPPRTSEEIAFILAHKITPNQADPNDMRPGATNRYQEGTTPLPTFLQALNATMTQRTAGQSVDGQNKADQASYWPGQRRNTKRTKAQNRAALVGVIIWFLFIIVSMLMSLFRK
ncbi:hypothetical protein [Candidatus Cryosericum septentrionale]|uniref:Uncharacterized protein n=1 Tax=Candidatus Cryosericum septentrionale TaxID=2290913 RepID=A0A398DPA7_9BACT|nr:hypothetical protein [Candidatus Cryosericum septentrionale]RIE15799.1 hypothetical protein SMC1_09470 [Candidatus Cryosericum septentrionale]